MTASVRVYQEGDLWIHEFADGYIVDRSVNERSSLSKFDQYTEDTWEYLYSPRPGDVIIDIGAGIGSEVHRWSREVGPTGLVVAVEAQPGTFACLKRFCELNGLDNVVPLNLAIMDQPGTAMIDDAAQHISSTILRENGGFEVEGTSLDLLVERLELDHIDFLKMNIEGAERLAIQGMARSLSLLRCLCISCHDFKADAGEGDFYRTKSLTESFLTQSGFAVVPRGNDEFPWIRDQVNAVPRKFALLAHTRRRTHALGRGFALARQHLTHARKQLAHTLAYSKHGYTRIVALKILVVRFLRTFRLKPPPPRR